MKIDSPSSVTPRDASIRLEWISTRILPGVGVLLLSIPICQWADSILPDDIVPVYVTYIMSVTVLWSMYMALQYAFAGIAQAGKTKQKAQKNQDVTDEQTEQEPVLLLEAEPVANTSEYINVADETNTIQSPTVAEAGNDVCVREHEALPNDTCSSATYQQGIDDFFQNQAECQKKRIETIKEYICYIMSPFIYEEDMNDFCSDLLKFAMDHNYRPETEWTRFKTRLSSFDIRHLVWSIASRLGLGKGKLYSSDDCASYIESRFSSLCVTASGEPLSHSTLRNLTVTSNSDQIKCDYTGKDGLLFHIPSQLGSK